MAIRSDFFSFIYSRAVIPFIGIAAGIIYTAAVFKWGPGITDDSINYLYASTLFPDELRKVDHTPFAEFPPLFPVILSAHKLFGISSVTFVAILHGLLFAGNVLLSWAMLRKLISSSFILLVATITILFSTPLLLIHVFAWSEAIFLTLFLLSLITLSKYINHSRSITYLIILILLTCLMGLQRKNGVMFLLSNSFIILLYGRSFPLVKKITHTFLYFITCSIPLLIYGLTNRKKIFVDAEFDPALIVVNLINVLEISTSWFFPDELSLQQRILLLSGAATVIFIIIRVSSRIKRPRFKPLEVILLATPLLYSLILSLSLAYVYVQEGVDERVLSPAYVPVIVCSFILADITYRKISLLPVAGDFIYRRIFMILLIGWLSYPVVRTGFHIKNWNKSGTGGYNSALWHNNKLIGKLAKKEPEVPVYTNNIYAATYYIRLKQQKPVTFKKITSGKEDPEYLALCFKRQFTHPQQYPCERFLPQKKILLTESEFGEIYKITKTDNGRKRGN